MLLSALLLVTAITYKLFVTHACLTQALRMLRSEEYGGAQSCRMCVQTTVWAQLYHSACVLRCLVHSAVAELQPAANVQRIFQAACDIDRAQKCCT
jgi:hypothetical protein